MLWRTSGEVQKIDKNIVSSLLEEKKGEFAIFNKPHGSIVQFPNYKRISSNISKTQWRRDVDRGKLGRITVVTFSNL